MVSSFLAVKVPHGLTVTEKQFRRFIAANPDLRMERTAQGKLIVMSPTGSEDGNRNAELSETMLTAQISGGKYPRTQHQQFSPVRCI
ncbi:MAG: Uma2 family endonuclease [Oculatellaceae cyanobacterium bins.114]|nr:Uma2 family endonuclease [Oculatellaceae cyanobacterium bins.114]